MADAEKDVDQRAIEFRALFPISIRAAYRYAHNWTQSQACEEYNRLFPGDGHAPMTAKRLSDLERWPGRKNESLSVQALKRWAQVYETTPDQLVEVREMPHLSHVSRQFLADLSRLPVLKATPTQTSGRSFFDSASFVQEQAATVWATTQGVHSTLRVLVELAEKVRSDAGSIDWTAGTENLVTGCDHLGSAIQHLATASAHFGKGSSG